MAKIDKALAQLPKPSANLYETNSVPGTVSSKWIEMTGTRDLRVAYDYFYHNSVDYAGAVKITLLGARNAARKNDAEEANRLYQAALRYEQQFYLNDKAAIETVNANIDAVIVLTKAIDQLFISKILGFCGSNIDELAVIPDEICVSVGGKVGPYRCPVRDILLCKSQSKSAKTPMDLATQQ